MSFTIPSWLPWSLTALAIGLVLLQSLSHGRQIKALRGSLKDRCDTLGRELHATDERQHGSGAAAGGLRASAS